MSPDDLRTALDQQSPPGDPSWVCIRVRGERLNKMWASLEKETSRGTPPCWVKPDLDYPETSKAQFVVHIFSVCGLNFKQMLVYIFIETVWM